MAKLEIRIDLDNAAFADDEIGEIERVLTQVIRKLPEARIFSPGFVGGTVWENLRDVNGNVVGQFKYFH